MITDALATLASVLALATLANARWVLVGKVYRQPNINVGKVYRQPNINVGKVYRQPNINVGKVRRQPRF